MSKKTKLTYAGSGVNYHTLDPIKILAQKSAASTIKNSSIVEVGESRGESAYVWEEKGSFRAIVIEGLGTKNLVADAMYPVTKKSYYDVIAQDTVAMIINDLIVVGAKPQVITAYFAVGDSSWFLDGGRSKDLITGWANACRLAHVAWGGGETPTLTSIINPKTIDLSGSAVGIIKPKKRLTLGKKLRAGDVIVVIESSGIHANGLTFARAIAKKIPQGYKTKLKSGIMYGESLLKPTYIYAQVIELLFESGIDIHYMVNITGHGWRKLMRAAYDFTYRIAQLPPLPEVLDFIQKNAGISDAEMYGSFNMGAGFALFIPSTCVNKALKIIKKSHFKAWNVGVVEKGPKQVVIEPKNITFKGASLKVR